MAYLFLIVVAGIPVFTFAGWVGELTYLTQIDIENGKFYTYFAKKNTAQQVMAVHGKRQMSNP